MIDYEQKYKESLKKAKSILEHYRKPEYKEILPYFESDLSGIFSELKESEDERIRKQILDLVKKHSVNHERCIMESWLEKQKETTNFQEAEQEKIDFVSGQFIQCRKSFYDFKENESYWFEYIGDDTYIGRSDNILNKKFHITPRQLFKLFSQQHDKQYEEQNEQAAEISSTTNVL